MTPEQEALFNQTVEKLQQFLEVYYKMDYPDKFIIRKELVLGTKLTLADGTVVTVGGTVGVTIGESGSKLGFFGATPVAQQSAVTSPSGGGGSSTDAIDISARTAIGQIKTILSNLGLSL